MMDRLEGEIRESGEESDAVKRITPVVGLRRSGREQHANIRLTGYALHGASIEGTIPWEVAMVGAGVGSRFNNTEQLIARTFYEVMNTETDEELIEWADAIDNEHHCMINNDVWIPVFCKDYPQEIPITTTWSMKLRSKGVMRLRVNARGFEQIPHVHYDPDAKSAPVVNMTTIWVVLVLEIMNKRWTSKVLDVKEHS